MERVVKVVPDNVVLANNVGVMAVEAAVCGLVCGEIFAMRWWASDGNRWSSLTDEHCVLGLCR